MVYFAIGIADNLQHISRAAMNPEKLNDYWLETWNERSAILEYDAGMTRHDAEQAAWDEISIMILKCDK